MSAPLVLSKKEQKKSLSGIKSRKKKKKNVLATPTITKFREPVVNTSNFSIISANLNRLLLKFHLIRKDKELESRSPELEKNKLIEENNSIKSQLLLGINSVSRGVSNGSVTSMILANDIKPKLLIKHLLLLCSLKNIPYIYMGNLRQLTKTILGFSSIVLGFKKDSTFFLPVTSLITTAAGNQSSSIIDTAVENVVTNADKIIERKRETSEKKQITFTYLYRDSNKKRIFSPDSEGTVGEQDSSKSFISLEIEDDSKRSVHVKFEKKISEGNAFRLDKGENIARRIINERTNEAELDFPVQYIETKIMKVEANPDRDKKKYKKLKKIEKC